MGLGASDKGFEFRAWGVRVVWFLSFRFRVQGLGG